MLEVPEELSGSGNIWGRNGQAAQVSWPQTLPIHSLHESHVTPALLYKVDWGGGGRYEISQKYLCTMDEK